MDHKLTQQLPRGTTTYEKRVDGETQKTTIDLVWAAHHLADRLICCQDQRDWFNGADHVPVLTEFDPSVIAASEIIRKNWKATDWDTFLK